MRKDDLFFRNELNFFLVNFPFSLLIFLVLNYLFYKIQASPISYYLRIFSFTAFIIQLAVESNVEQFVFEGYRNFRILFFRVLLEKLLTSLFVLFGFFFIFLISSSYYLYLFLYKGLSKYFLDNVYRVNGSYALMFFIYAFRPFSKGVIHASLYDDNEKQLICLACVELATFCVMVLI